MSAPAIPTKGSKPSSAFENILKRMAGIKPTEKITDSQRSDLYMCAVKNLIAFALLITAGITLFVAIYNSEVYSKNYYKYMLLIVLPIVVSSYMLLPIFSQKISTPTAIMIGFMVIIFVLSVYAFNQIKSPESLIIVQYSIYAITVLSVIVGLAILYKFFNRLIYNTRGAPSVILQVIFFIPCLLVDFIEYIKNQMKITPKTTYILLAIEAIVLFVYFVLLQYLPARPDSNTQILLHEPVFLNRISSVGDKTVFLVDIDNSIQTRQNFTISFWSFINNNIQPVTILRIGNKDDEFGKFHIMSDSTGNYWCTITNTPADKLSMKRFLLNPNKFSVQDMQANKENKPILPIQKWNHIAITVQTNKMFVLLNGNLHEEYVLDGHIFQFKNDDMILVGMDLPNSNVGAVCNVRYHFKPLTENDVSRHYKALENKNPPVNEDDTRTSKPLPYVDTIKQKYKTYENKIKRKYERVSDKVKQKIKKKYERESGKVERKYERVSDKVERKYERESDKVEQKYNKVVSDAKNKLS